MPSKKRKREEAGGGRAGEEVVCLLQGEEEPQGIDDDLFLLQGLGPKRAECVHWQLVGDSELGNARRWIFRSIWDWQTDKFRTWLSEREKAAVAASPPRLCALAELSLYRVTAHKRYLKRLEARGVKIVPTRILSQVGGSERVAGASPMVAGEVYLAVAGMGADGEKRKGGDWILKPANGTRCRGVLRLKVGAGKPAGQDRAVAELRARSDTLLQPFLAPCVGGASGWGGGGGEGRGGGEESTARRRRLLGEVCCIFVDGELVHCIHKLPQLWGRW